MELKKTIKVLEQEKECVLRQDTPKCNRDCKNCDLLLPTEDVVTAYETAIRILTIIDH